MQQRAADGWNQSSNNEQPFAGRESLGQQGQQFSRQQDAGAGWQGMGQEPARQEPARDPSAEDSQGRLARNQVPGNNQNQQGMWSQQGIWNQQGIWSQSAQEEQNSPSYPNNFPQNNFSQRNIAQPSASEIEKITTELFRSLSLDKDYYKGAVLREINVGISNESYIEVISGLNAGEIVVLPQLANTTGNARITQQQQNMGGFGGMGGLTGIGGSIPAGGGNIGNSGRIQFQQQPQRQR